MAALRHALEALDPLHGTAYQFWSGIGSGSPVLAAAIVWWKRHSCHVRRCWRVSWHPHPGHGHPVCKRHHPHDAGNLTEEVNP